MESARYLLLDLQITHEFWGDAVLTGAHIHNRILSQSHNNTSPIVFWTGKAPTIGHFRVFGSTDWVHVPKERRRKQDAKSIRGILVGCEEEAGTKVYRIYDRETKRVLVFRDVIIDESTVPSPNNSSDNPAEKTKIECEPESQIPKSDANIRTDIPDEYLKLDPVTFPPECWIVAYRAWGNAGLRICRIAPWG